MEKKKEVASMIYTSLTNKAMKLAYAAHCGQADKGGIPYIFHPYHLAEQMTEEISACVALLHDVVEDTDVTFEELAQEFPKEVIEALRLLTHAEGTDYLEYVKAIKANPVARAVKLADIAHNSDESRLEGCEGITEEQRGYFREKYARARVVLEE